MIDRQVRVDDPADRRPDGREPHQPGPHRAAARAGRTWHACSSSAIETSRPLIEESGTSSTVMLPPTSRSSWTPTTTPAGAGLHRTCSPTRPSTPTAAARSSCAWCGEGGDGERVGQRQRHRHPGRPAGDACSRCSRRWRAPVALARRAGHRPVAGAGVWSSCTAARSRRAARGLGQGSVFVVALPSLPGATVPRAGARPLPRGLRARAAAPGPRRRRQPRRRRRPGRAAGADGPRGPARCTTARRPCRGGEFRPDVVLLDIGMPLINGYEACRRVNEQPWGKQLAVDRPHRVG